MSDKTHGVNEGARAIVEARAGFIDIENVYLVNAPSDPDDETEGDGDDYTAYLYDPNDGPEELVTGDVGPVTFRLTRAQAANLRNQIDGKLG